MNIKRSHRRIGSAVGSLTAAAAVATGTCGSTAAAGAGRRQLETPSLVRVAAIVPRSATSTLDAAGVRRLGRLRWRGGDYRAADGTVSVSVSAAYASDPGAAQRWADFFASLVHGSELALLRAYVAPLDEVQAICGGDGNVLGCYGANRLVTVGDASGGIPPESVAAHEYGHHVANNRLNPPWIAVNWGTKRWASDMNICERAAGGTAYPGAEDARYTLNPGEGFAESYRVLNETLAGGPVPWEIVDNSFRPDAAALEAIREDVLQPWSTRTTRTIHGRFARGRITWTLALAAPLDGTLSLELGTGSDGLKLLDARTHQILGRGAWTQTGGKSLDYQVCGLRSLVVSVTRSGRGPRTFSLRISAP